jgi:hypothetical protein
VNAFGEPQALMSQITIESRRTEFLVGTAVRHPVQMRESWPQSQRSAFASRTRRGLERCSTCSWCRKASTSSWSAARDRAHVRRVRRSETSTDIMTEKRTHRRPQHQLPQQERTSW